MKRVLISFFAIMFAGQAWAAETFTVGDFFYTVIDDVNNYVSIHVVVGNKLTMIGDLEIPTTVENGGITYTVTSIDKLAFSFCEKLTSVTIPNTVASIGESAFYDCSRLTSVTIPNSVTSIGESAFAQCENLSKLNIPNSIVSIGFDVFPKLSENDVKYSWDYSLKNLQFNEYGNACYIGNEENPYLCLVKAKSTEITSCTINAKCKAIYGGAFKGCEELKSIAIPNTVTFIGRNAFEDCINLTIYCQAKVKHSKWDRDWNPNWCDVVWGATYKFK